LNIHHFFQIDLPPKGENPSGVQRFWMDSCGGRDQVARQISAQGWRAYEAPLPTLIEAWCSRLQAVFLDIGANTGFYSLLAATSGARHVHAFEPVTEIADVLKANVVLSELQTQISLHPCALGKQVGSQTLYFPLGDHGLVETSASMNANFRARHAEQRQVPVQTLDALIQKGLQGIAFGASVVPLLIKIDVETAEPAVLAGAQHTLKRYRPALVCEILPESDLDYWSQMADMWGYLHHHTLPNAPWLSASTEIQADAQQRDHVFLPQENADLWLRALKD